MTASSSLQEKSVKQQENTLQMKREYMKWHRMGLTPKEIAKKFHLSSWTVYHYLDEIAKENGVTREELLANNTSSNALDNITVDYVCEGLLIEVEKVPRKAGISTLTSYAKKSNRILEELDNQISNSISEMKKP